MNQARTIYSIARADFIERVRRYSFLITLGFVVFLGYQAAIGHINVQVENYRGEFNSAWVGGMLAVIASFFLGLFGFYLVKGSVERDRETGVGQIMATTPLTRPLYTIGKWLSNFAVLISMLIVLAISGIAIQILASESSQFDFAALFTPFLFISLPMLALVASIAVLFESSSFLRGSLGNVVYFFIFLLTLPLADGLSKANPALEPVGLRLLQQSMGAAAKTKFPNYSGGFILGSTDIPILGTFHWSGVAWTAPIILERLAFIGVAMILALLAAVFFDRFDPSHWRPIRVNSSASIPEPEAANPTRANTNVHLTPINASASPFTFVRVWISELKMLLKGQRWWWYATAGGLWVASLTMNPENVRAFILPLAWLWPLPIWSAMGNREIRYNTQQMVFSSAAPLTRQLPAEWLAGFTVAILAGSGAALKLLSVGDGAGLLAWHCAALFIPSLALAAGVLSNSQKLFEVLYVTLWYLGPMNKVYALDFSGAHSSGNTGFFLPFTLALVVIAFIGRARQLQN
jgi:hypothetical protein